MTYSRSVSQNREYAAVVVHFNSPETLARTLGSLSGAGLAPTQIIVVDNSQNLGDTFGSLCSVIDPGSNLGYGRGVNFGVSAALSRGHIDAFVVCTHEVVFLADSLTNLLEEAASRSLSVVGPVLHDENGGRLWSAGGKFSALQYPAHITNIGREPVRLVKWLDGAAFATTPAVWLKTGGIPEEFFMYMEDVAFGLNASQLGVRVLVVRDSHATQTANGPKFFFAVRNRLILAERYYSWWARAIVWLEFGVRLAIAAILDREKFSERLRACRDGLRIVRGLVVRTRSSSEGRKH